jgi:hypothetical protein
MLQSYITIKLPSSTRRAFSSGVICEILSLASRSGISLSQEYGLLAPDHISITKLRGLILEFDLFKMNIWMLGLFWTDWGWSFD